MRTPPTVPLVLALLVGALSADATQPAQARRPLVVDDLSAVRQVADPQISPDGNWVAYTITETDVKADLERSDLWMTRWDGSETVRLTETPESEHAPRWSPDGKQLAFLSTGPDRDAAEQLWLIDPSGGTPKRVTSLANGVSDFDWAPDSRRLVLISGVTPDGSPERSAAEPIVIDRMLIAERVTVGLKPGGWV